MLLLKKGSLLLQRRQLLRVASGVDYSKPSTLVDTSIIFPQNVRLQQEEIRKREGKTQFGTGTISGANGIVHLATYPMNTEVIKLLRMSKTTVEVYNSNTDTWDNITGTALTGIDTDFFDDTLAEDTYLFTQKGVGPIRKWTGTGNTSALGGAGVPQARFLEYLEPYLIVGYLDSGAEKHQAVQWTDSGNITAWSGGNSGSALLRYNATPLRGLHLLNEYCVAYKKDCIYMGRRVDTSDVIKWDLVEVGTGLLSSRALTSDGGYHYFMGLNDFHIFNGVRTESIGKPVRDEVFRIINTDKETSLFALHNSALREVWFFIVVSGGTYPTKIFRYAYKTGFWFIDTCTSIRTAVEFFNQSAVSWDAATGTWDSNTTRWDDNVLITNSPKYIFGSQDGKSYYQDAGVSNDAGVSVDAYFDTLDYSDDDLSVFKRWLQVEYWAKGTNITISYSTDEGVSYTSIETRALTDTMTKYITYFDVVSLTIRFRFRNNTTGETFTMRPLVQPYLVEREASR